MMSRGFYIGLAVLLFSITYLPDLLSTIIGERILIDYIPRVRLKLILLFLICIMESTLIKREYPGIFGWLLSFLLLIGFLMRVTHWNYANEIIIISAALILANLITHAILEKNKSLFHYMLFGFIALRVTITLSQPNEILWWLDLCFGALIAIIGIWYVLKLNRRGKN